MTNTSTTALTASADAVSDLIHAIYLGARETAPWSQFLDQLRVLLNADVTAIVLRFPNDRDRGAIYASGGDPQRMARSRRRTSTG